MSFFFFYLHFVLIFLSQKPTPPRLPPLRLHSGCWIHPLPHPPLHLRSQILKLDTAKNIFQNFSLFFFHEQLNSVKTKLDVGLFAKILLKKTVTDRRFCRAGLPLTVAYVLEVCKQVFVLWLLLLHSCKEDEDKTTFETLICYTAEKPNCVNLKKKNEGEKKQHKRTCTFPCLIVGSVPWHVGGASAAMTLFGFVTIFIW